MPRLIIAMPLVCTGPSWGLHEDLLVHAPYVKHLEGTIIPTQTAKGEAIFISRDTINLHMFYESHLHFLSDLCIKLLQIYTANCISHSLPQRALYLDDLLETNDCFSVVIHNWKSTGDKKIYGNE